VKIIPLEKQKHIDQVILCLEQAFQHPFYQLQQRFWLDDETNWQWIWGAEEEGRIVGTYVSFDVTVCLRGKPFQAHYLDGLATLPQYRNRGWIKEMMLKDFHFCREKHIPLIMLDPFKHSFYRKYGFETVADCKSLIIPWSLLSDRIPRSFQEKEQRIYLAKISIDSYAQKTYLDINRRALQSPYYNEMRRPDSYEQALFLDHNLWIAIAIDGENNAQGYLLFYIENRFLNIIRMKFFTLNTFYCFKKFILQNQDQVRTVKFQRVSCDFPLDLFVHSLWQNGEKIEWIEMSSRMMRIVDIQRLFREFPEICERSEDLPGIEDQWMDIPLELQSRPDKWTMDVSAFGQLVTGYRSAYQLFRQGVLRFPGETKDTLKDRVWETTRVPEFVENLDRLFPARTTYQTDNWV
jgi:predicted acetyltransferase